MDEFTANFIENYASILDAQQLFSTESFQGTETLVKKFFKI